MAPSHSPGLLDFHTSSPRIFWTVFGVFVLAFLLLLGWVLRKVFVYARQRRTGSITTGNAHRGKVTPRDLLLPRHYRDRHGKKQSGSAKLLRALRSKFFVRTFSLSVILSN